MIYVVTTFTIRPGSLEPFVDIAYPAIEATRREPGCLMHDLHASVTDPDKVVFIDKWESQDALSTHLSAPHLARFIVQSQPYIVDVKTEIIHPDRIETT